MIMDSCTVASRKELARPCSRTASTTKHPARCCQRHSWTIACRAPTTCPTWKSSPADAVRYQLQRQAAAKSAPSVARDRDHAGRRAVAARRQSCRLPATPSRICALFTIAPISCAQPDEQTMKDFSYTSHPQCRGGRLLAANEYAPFRRHDPAAYHENAACIANRHCRSGRVACPSRDDGRWR